MNYCAWHLLITVRSRIKALCILLFSLNLLDALTTTYFISTGLGYEANPVMSWVISKGIEWFWIAKVVIGGGISYIFYIASHHRFTRNALVVCVLAYSALAIYHAVIYVRITNYLSTMQG